MGGEKALHEIGGLFRRQDGGELTRWDSLGMRTDMFLYRLGNDRTNTSINGQKLVRDQSKSYGKSQRNRQGLKLKYRLGGSINHSVPLRNRHNKRQQFRNQRKL
jgi:hypothetical protein